MMTKDKGPEWGDYYYQSKRPSGRTAWVLELVHQINQSVPRFDEIFDEETFYVFAILLVIGSICLALFASRIMGVKIKEHTINIDRDWGEPTPANPFHFPWKRKNE